MQYEIAKHTKKNPKIQYPSLKICGLKTKENIRHRVVGTKLVKFGADIMTIGMVE